MFGQVSEQRKTRYTPSSASVVPSSAQDPVGIMWANMAGAHGSVRQPVEEPIDTTPLADASGKVYEAVTEDVKKDKQESLHREMYDRWCRHGRLKPSPKAKYDPMRLQVQSDCPHKFEHLKRGANGVSEYDSCTAFGLESCIMYPDQAHHDGEARGSRFDQHDQWNHRD